MTAFEGKVDATAVLRMLETRKAEVPGLAKSIVAGVVAMHQTEMRKRTSGRGGSKLRRRTGALNRSLRAGPAVNAFGGYQATSNIGRGAPYAITQEEGRTIRPKKKYLTIPLRAARTNARVTRANARLVQVGGKWKTKGKLPGATSRDTFIYERRGRKFIAVEGHGNRALPIYFLARSVKVPARLGFVDTFVRQRVKRGKLYARKLNRWVEGQRQ